MWNTTIDFNDIKGQEHVKRGMEVACTGHHNVLLIGVPGSGKKMFKEAVRNISDIDVYMMNPCFCGNFTDPAKECLCTPLQIQRHIQIASDIIPLDDIDIHLEIPRLNLQHITNRKGEKSKDILERIQKIQSIPSQPLLLDKEAEELLKLAILELGISAIAYDKIIRVGTTIAKMDGKSVVEAHHISEAISYRSLDRNLWG